MTVLPRAGFSLLARNLLALTPRNGQDGEQQSADVSYRLAADRFHGVIITARFTSRDIAVGKQRRCRAECIVQTGGGAASQLNPTHKGVAHPRCAIGRPEGQTEVRPDSRW